MKKFVPFYYDTCGRLRAIFAEHCNLSGEQYEEISKRLIYLVSDIQMLEEKDEALTLEQVVDGAEQLGIIFEFLLNTKELFLEEYNDLCNMVGELADAAQKAVE